MPTENVIWEMYIVLLDSFTNLPTTGDATKLYIDKSTASTEDFSDGQAKYWNTAVSPAIYALAVGPRPKPKH